MFLTIYTRIGTLTLMKYLLLIFLTITFLVISCATEQPQVVAETESESTQEQQPVEEEAVEEPVIETIEEEPAVEVDTQEETVADTEIEQAEEGLKVSEEVFMETFEDITDLISSLNKIIASENYDEWLTYLTRGYIEHMSSAEELKNVSEQPLLRKYDINLRSLKDYFKYVVVPSRSNARLDDLVFLDTNLVKAIMIINEQRTILYRLEKNDGVWKIGL